MRESAIEKAVCDYARQAGCLTIKNATPGHRGVPDRMFIRNGKCLFIEFKAPGKKPGALQLKWRADLWAHGVPAVCVDSIAAGNEAVFAFL